MIYNIDYQLKRKSHKLDISKIIKRQQGVVVVVYHVTIVALDMGCWRNVSLFVIGCVLRTAGSSFKWAAIPWLPRPRGCWSPRWRFPSPDTRSKQNRKLIEIIYYKNKLRKKKKKKKQFDARFLQGKIKIMCDIWLF